MSHDLEIVAATLAERQARSEAFQAYTHRVCRRDRFGRLRLYRGPYCPCLCRASASRPVGNVSYEEPPAASYPCSNPVPLHPN